MTRHLFHILDYRNWHNSKKISSRRKHRRGKHTLCCGFSETISFKHYADEAHDYLNADVVPLIGYSRRRELDNEELLEQLPTLQQLLCRLVGCRPGGAAVANHVIQYALALV